MSDCIFWIFEVVICWGSREIFWNERVYFLILKMLFYGNINMDVGMLCDNVL